jgi:hypothetical protein
MRADMAKVIVERPRRRGYAWNKPKGYQRRLRRLRDDGPPLREGIKTRWQGHTKDFNEHLGPLRRYLNSQVGRPWDKVFSEICAHISRNSAVQDHVRDHVAEYVTTHVILVDGVPCSGEGGLQYGTPLHQLPWKPWYVCPHSGLLKRIRFSGRRRGRTRMEKQPAYVPLSETLQCRLIAGAWHLVILKPLPLVRIGRPERDVVLNKPISILDETTVRQFYGAVVYATGKRRLTRRELRQYPIPVDAWV